MCLHANVSIFMGFPLFGYRLAVNVIIVNTVVIVTDQVPLQFRNSQTYKYGFPLHFACLYEINISHSYSDILHPSNHQYWDSKHETIYKYTCSPSTSYTLMCYVNISKSGVTSFLCGMKNTGIVSEREKEEQRENEINHKKTIQN